MICSGADRNRKHSSFLNYKKQRHVQLQTERETNKKREETRTNKRHETKRTCYKRKIDSRSLHTERTKHHSTPRNDEMQNVSEYITKLVAPTSTVKTLYLHHHGPEKERLVPDCCHKEPNRLLFRVASTVEAMKNAPFAASCTTASLPDARIARLGSWMVRQAR